MSDSYIQVPPDSTGKKLDTEQLTVGANTVERERMQIAGDSATDIAPVTAADGLLVNLGTNNDVSVTGTVTVDGSGVTQPVSAASLPLPTGAATAANQLPDGHNVTVDNAAGAAAVNIQDGGNSITVDGTVSVTEPVSVDDNGGSLTVDNAALAVVGGGAEATALRVTVANDSTGVLSVDDNGGSLTVDGTVTIQDGGNVITVDATNLDIRDLTAASDSVAVHGDVGILDQVDLTNANPLTVAIVNGDGDQITSFGGGTQYTEGDTDATITGTAMLWEDGSDTLKPVAAATPLPVNVVAGGTSGTEYTEDAAAAANPVGGTIIMVRDDALSGQTSADGDNVAVRGTDKGELYVKHVDSIPVTDNGGSLTVDGTVAVTQSGVWDEVGINDSGNSITVDNGTLSVVGGGAEATALRVTVANDSTGVLSVDDNGGSLTVDGTVAVSSLPASTNTLEVVGDVAADVGAAGNPVQIGVVQETMADSAPSTRVSADADIGYAAASDGAQYVIPTGPQTWSYHENSSSALTDTSVHAAPGAGLSLYVTDIIVSTGAATAFNIFFEEGASTVLGPYYLEAVAGRGFQVHFQTPKKITANTALTVTTSAAIAHGIDVTGFIARG